MRWNLADAKDRLSELVRRAETEGPQPISVRGREAVVVISSEAFRRLQRPDAPKDFKDWLLAGPSFEGVDLERDSRPGREIDRF